MAHWKRTRLEAEGRVARDPSNKQPPLPSLVQIQPKNHHPAGTHSLTVRPKCIDVVKAWQGTVSGMFNNFPNRDNLHSPNSNAPIQAADCTATASHHLFTCDELGYIDDWKRFGKLNQMQKLEDWMVQSTYWTETPWFANNGADFKEGSSESDTLIGIPVSFSSMEVEASNGGVRLHGDASLSCASSCKDANSPRVNPPHACPRKDANYVGYRLVPVR
ncbi:hypothetical protein PVK06_047306 [Gossypium arboreum]|uniref:Uncharacterized protein n=1 Tax=Gossypium arboreum TaxID=29729 RepID=A0ABR0MD95_GOSAR|nr:hypothetical protein PVK06_047306 [Gossypium arboreum]